MRSHETPWAAVAARQHAVLSHRQLLDAGLSPRQVELRVGRGLLVPVHRDVYRLAGVLPTWQQAAMAACLASGGVASHRCAAAWGVQATACGGSAPQNPRRGRAVP